MKILLLVEPAIYLLVLGDHQQWKSGDFRAKISGQIVGQKIGQFPKFMQNNEKTTVFQGFKPQKRSFFGRSDRTRTCSILLPKQARYQLRHTSKCVYKWSNSDLFHKWSNSWSK